MGKRLSLSALISGLLAAPAIAAPPPVAQVPGVPLVEPAAVSAFPVEMPADLKRQLRKAMAGKPLDAFGMQGLRRKLAEEALQRVTRVREEGALEPVQAAAADATTQNGAGQNAAGGQSGGTVLLIGPQGRTQVMGGQVMQVAGAKEKAAFLGISTSPAPAILRQQLGVPRGMGLVVDFVEKDSPAAGENGLKKFDVLQKFDDQLLVNPQQLAVLVRAKKPGDSAVLTLVRDGKSMTVTVKLVEREVPALEEMGGVNLNGSPMGGVERPGGNGEANGAGAAVRASAASINRVDAEHDITLKTVNGKRTLTVKDLKTGAVVFDGPADTEGDLKSLPAGVMEKVKAMQAVGK